MHYNLTFDFFPSQYYSSSSPSAWNRNAISHSHATRPKIAQETDDPISYYPLVQATQALMHAQAARADRIPESFAQRASNNSKFTLSANEWTIYADKRPLAHLRMVYIQGAKSSIINTWIFPTRPSQMPVFAAELIGVGSATKVLFVDIQVPALAGHMASDVSAVTSAIAPRFASLPCNETPPDWATHDSQGYFTYARDVPCGRTDEVEDCYCSYLETYLAAFTSDALAKRIAASPRDEQAVSRLQDYQLHHMEHSPGNKFLSKLFGSDWTEAFMKNFLFAKPRG